MLWRGSPASFEGCHHRFSDASLEPKPFRERVRPCGSAARRCTSGSCAVSSKTGVVQPSGNAERRGPRASVFGDDGRRPRHARELEMVGGTRAGSPTPRGRRPRRSAPVDPRTARTRLHDDLDQPSQFIDDLTDRSVLPRGVRAGGGARRCTAARVHQCQKLSTCSAAPWAGARLSVTKHNVCC